MEGILEGGMQFLPSAQAPEKPSPPPTIDGASAADI